MRINLVTFLTLICCNFISSMALPIKNSQDSSSLLSVKEVIDNFDSFVGYKIKVTGRVLRDVGSMALSGIVLQDTVYLRFHIVYMGDSAIYIPRDSIYENYCEPSMPLLHLKPSDDTTDLFFTPFVSKDVIVEAYLREVDSTFYPPDNPNVYYYRYFLEVIYIDTVSSLNTNEIQLKYHKNTEAINRGSGEIQFLISKPSAVTFEIFNVEGRIIKQIVNSYHTEGWHTLTLDEIKEVSGGICSGVFFLRFLVNSENIYSDKILLLR